MSAAATSPDAVLETYVADVLDAIEEAGRVTVAGAYLLGSAATASFDSRTSDVDLVVVVDRAPAAPARRELIEALGRLGCPFRALELVIYVEGAQPPDFELNLNVTSGGAIERPDEPRHWFIVDAALAQDRAVPFGDDEPWSAHFAPVSAEQLTQALHDSIAWSHAQPVDNEFARLNERRSRHYLEHGEWMTKAEARKERR